ncbi:MAG: hypothetical protein ACT4OY_05045 [Alphaproteobacteria bacterium]
MQNNKPNQTKPARNEFAGLPASSIMHHLIGHSQKLVDLSDKETQALVQNDMLAFAILQYEKDSLTTKYVGISKEFRSRLEEFRHLDRGHLNKLEALQKTLSEKSHANNAIIAKLKHRIEKNTHQTLLAAQEIAQTRHIHFEKSVQQQGEG